MLFFAGFKPRAQRRKWFFLATLLIVVAVLFVSAKPIEKELLGFFSTTETTTTKASTPSTTSPSSPTSTTSSSTTVMLGTTTPSTTSTTTAKTRTKRPIRPGELIDPMFREEKNFTDEYWQEPSPDEEVDFNMSDAEGYDHFVHEQIREAYRDFNSTSQNNTHLFAFADAQQIFKIAPKYNLASCTVEKCMSTRLDGIFCYLYDSTHFANAGLLIEKHNWTNLFCKYINEVHTVEGMGRRLREYDTIFVVRDPLARFVSAYVDKCIHEFHKYKDTCYKCYKDIGCFLEHLKKEALWWGRLQNKDLEDLSYTLRHFAPQNWYCAMGKYHKHYIFLKYEEGSNLRNELLHILKRKNVPQFEIDRVEESLQDDVKAPHATSGSVESMEIRNQILSDPTLLKQVMWFYESDYRLLGFPRPKV